MDHFYEKIDGWHNATHLYRRVVAEARDGDIFVEIGCWKGRSAAFMGVEIVNSGKRIAFHVVDNFKGSKEHAEHDCIQNKTLEAELFDNLAPLAGHCILAIHKGDSAAAVEDFWDASLAFAYIDASHEYEHVRADILAWLPKMRPGGLLAGDDFESYPDVGRAVGELLPGFTRSGNVWEYRCPST